MIENEIGEKMFCKHDWEEQSRQFGYDMRSGGFTLDIPDKTLINPYSTLITERCIHCGKYRQKLLRGHVPIKTGIPEVFRKGLGQEKL